MRSSILDLQSGISQVFARHLGTHRFQRAVSTRDALIGSDAPRIRISCFEHIARPPPRPGPSELSPLNSLLSTTARWKRCAPSFIPTAPQKLHAPTLQSSILPKPMNVTILPPIMRLGVIINLLIWVGLSSPPYLWPNSPPVHASDSVRSAVQSAQESNS
jgi:hypothetical protein